MQQGQLLTSSVLGPVDELFEQHDVGRLDIQPGQQLQLLIALASLNLLRWAHTL